MISFSITGSIIRMSTNSTFTENSTVRLAYGLALSVGTMVLFTTILVASYLCMRLRHQTQLSNGRRRRDSIHVTVDHNEGRGTGGIDEATLDSYPKMKYSEKVCEAQDGSCCSICLAEYKETDVVRVLPDCGHMFHVGCIDEWLRRHTTCPMCRTSPLPSLQSSPLSTPLSEFIPIARHDSLRRQG